MNDAKKCYWRVVTAVVKGPTSRRQLARDDEFVRTATNIQTMYNAYITKRYYCSRLFVNHPDKI